MGKEAWEDIMNDETPAEAENRDSRFALYPSDVYFRYSASSGPGGQGVNKTESRATAIFNVDSCPRLTPEQKERIKTRVPSGYVFEGEEGVTLRVTSQETRHQKQNRENAVARLAEIIVAALEVPKERKETKVPRGEREARLADKKRRGEIKKKRGKVERYEE